MASPSEPAARVFFAIVPPPATQAALADLARSIAPRVKGRAVPVENMHLTLAFVGPWADSRMHELHAAGAAVRGEPFRLTLDTLGGFRRAGIAWIGPSHPPPHLITLAAALGDALRNEDVSYDARVFRPHVTLARRVHGRRLEEIVDPVSFDVDAFSLMESKSQSAGVRYDALTSWSL
ncbi:MAG TPA: RNA 2',3'-cyclic phosphodiesterase [Casimicrobiaceae bacterium]|nr:RNA 2',3'-cyclic phosphodiesterase [Casimicrobiaceae bacterium]